MQTTTEQLGKDRVKLRVEVPESALDDALGGVYRRWAGEIRMPGFRKGKVPRPLIDARVGVDAIREEALRDALPELYRDALNAEELEAIAPPEIEIVNFETGAPIVFEATVDVRPEISIPDLSAISIEAPSTEVTDEDLEAQLDRLRDRFAELETVSREVRSGDFALIDLKGYRNGELVDEASAPDFLYEVGSRTGPPKLDDELEGNKPGAILKFRAGIPEGSGLAGEELSFTVLLKEVKAKKLPEVDDEFAKTVGEFETIEDLKEELRGRIAEMKQGMAEEEMRSRALEALVDASDLESPEKLVEAEFEHRLQHMEEDLKRVGLSVAQYTERIGSTELELRSDLRRSAARSVKAELLLEEIARAEEVQVTEEDLGREIAIAAARAEREPDEVARELAASGRVSAVAADIMRRKALDHVVEVITVNEESTKAGE